MTLEIIDGIPLIDTQLAQDGFLNVLVAPCVSKVLVHGAASTARSFCNRACWGPEVVLQRTCCLPRQHGGPVFVLRLVIFDGALHSVDIAFYLRTCCSYQVAVQQPTHTQANCIAQTSRSKIAGIRPVTTAQNLTATGPAGGYNMLDHACRRASGKNEPW